MSEQPLISVIVPVYKVEPYLDRCVQSIVNQTYENLEIILVWTTAHRIIARPCATHGRRKTAVCRCFIKKTAVCLLHVMLE